MGYEVDFGQSLISYVVHILSVLVIKKGCTREYLYYRTPSPWLQIKLLKFLQLYSGALFDKEGGAKPDKGKESAVNQLYQVVSKILTETDS